MLDLALAIAVLLGLSISLFLFGAHVASKAVPANAIAILTVAVLFLFAICLHGRIVLAQIIPLSNVVVLGNFYPLFAGLLAGILFGDKTCPVWRRYGQTFALLTIGWFTVAWSTVPNLRFLSENRYLNGVCLQSSPTSCGACAAVTLLDQYSIDSSEQELSSLSLTNGRGTNVLGIYRALTMKTRGSPYRVRVVRCGVEEVKADDLVPMIAIIRVPDDLPVEKASRHKAIPADRIFGRVDHCVVVLRFSKGGQVVVADPADKETGVSVWTEAELEHRWLKEGFHLEYQHRLR